MKKLLFSKRRKIFFVLVLLSISSFSMAESITYFHNDISGSAVIVTDVSGGLVSNANYKPYGESMEIQGPVISNIGFHGKPFDQDTKLSYMGARYYDPALGRFLSTDPVDFKASNIHSFNKYSYANSNPYKYIDPDGRSSLISQFISAVNAAMNAAFGTTLYVASSTPTISSGVMVLDPTNVIGISDISNPSNWTSTTSTTISIPTIMWAKPSRGDPNTTYWPGPRPDGTLGDGRRFGKDGNPEVDYDFSHGNHKNKDGEDVGDHVHNWDTVPGKERPERGEHCEFCVLNY